MPLQSKQFISKLGITFERFDFKRGSSHLLAGHYFVISRLVKLETLDFNFMVGFFSWVVRVYAEVIK